MEPTTKINDPVIESMFKAGAHYGYTKARRHPSTKAYVYGVKNRVEIIDLEKSKANLEVVKKFIAELAKDGKQILFVSSKNEAKEAIKTHALSIGMPYVAGRWIGGTLTNWSEIRKRVDKYLDLQTQKERGELVKYTKKERLMIDRQITNLEDMFSGIVHLRSMPAALFVIDPKQEEIAVKEARQMKVPVIALSNTDCNIDDIEYPIVANDANRASIGLFVSEVSESYNAK
ncbi:MAG: 30S ribosomal protein S2 [bacterium]